MDVDGISGTSLEDRQQRNNKKPAKDAGLWTLDDVLGSFLVPGAGIEPALLAEPDFESGASTYFTTRAGADAILADPNLGIYGKAHQDERALCRE